LDKRRIAVFSLATVLQQLMSGLQTSFVNEVVKSLSDFASHLLSNVHIGV